MASGQQVAQWARANPNGLISIAVALTVIGISTWVGLKARGVANDIASSRAAWESTANQMATVQQQFRVPTSTEAAALIAEASRMGALGVPIDDKLGLVEVVGRLAEACGMTGVRVTTMPVPDSTYLPQRQVPGSSVRAAEYALYVEFSGGFAGAQKFVSSLPPSVSVSRLAAVRRDRGTLYQLVLSVYELDAQSGN